MIKLMMMIIVAMMMIIVVIMMIMVVKMVMVIMTVDQDGTSWKPSFKEPCQKQTGRRKRKGGNIWSSLFRMFEEQSQQVMIITRYLNSEAVR